MHTIQMGAFLGSILVVHFLGSADQLRGMLLLILNMTKSQPLLCSIVALTLAPREVD